MRGGRLLAIVTGAMVTLAACGGGGSAAIGNPPLPTLPSAGGGASASAGSSSAPAVHQRHHVGARASATSAARSSSPGAAARRPSPSHSSSPSHHASSSPAPSCVGISGRTTTIQEQPLNKFAPSTVTISRCDSVKAVGADSTAHHTFTGPGWDSGDMANGSSYTYKFASTGTFDFYCTYHKSEGMTGRITVT